VLLFSSCTVEKRRYTSGYHVDWKSRMETAEKKVSLSADNPIVSAVISEETAAAIPVIEPKAPQLVATRIVIVQAAPKAGSARTDKKVASSKKTFSFESLVQPSATVHHLHTGRAAHLDAASSASSVGTIFLIILAIFIPPLAVYLHQGSWNSTCWINLILTLLLWLPGVIHALIVVLA